MMKKGPECAEELEDTTELARGSMILVEGRFKPSSKVSPSFDSPLVTHRARPSIAPASAKSSTSPPPSSLVHLELPHSTSTLDWPPYAGFQPDLAPFWDQPKKLFWPDRSTVGVLPGDSDIRRTNAGKG